MRKSLAIIIHVIAVLVCAAMLITLSGYSAEDIGLSWTNDKTFEDSYLFSEMVSEDISDLKRFALLKSAFEGYDGNEVDKDIFLVYAVTSNGGASYTLGDFITQAARYGYTLDSATHRISVNEGTNSSEPYQLTVRYKAYDPYFLQRTEIGPTQGLTNIRDLSLEVLRALAEYYSLSSVFETEMTNFRYSLAFDLDEEYPYFIENTSGSFEDVSALGKYLLVSGDGSIETNIDPLPEGIFTDEGGYILSSDPDETVLSIGVDTSYIFSDRYSEAAESFSGDIEKIRERLVSMMAAALLAVISCIFVIRGFTETDRRESSVDTIPLELLIFAGAVVSIGIYAVFRQFFNSFLSELFSRGDRSYAYRISRYVIVWLVSVFLCSSLYRRSLHGGIFGHSLIRSAYLALSDDSRMAPARAAFGGYFIFIIIQLAAAYIIYRLHEFTDRGRIYMAAPVTAALLLTAFDIFIYLRRYRGFRQIRKIREATGSIANGQTDIRLDTEEFEGEAREIAANMNNISTGLRHAVNEQVKADKLKADLITNVSHDIRTPLTSIINYVDLIKRENVDSETVRAYVEVLDQKSERLKNLTDDLIEASKASSGNVNMDLRIIDMDELAAQAGGELLDKFSARNLELDITVLPHPAYVLADGRYLWRVFENLYNNAAKYSMEHTRVYAEVGETGNDYIFTIKNVSAEKLNISPDELTERFVRGDVSRNTEGSGLGLSIAKSLSELMNAKLRIEIDGDLYKASVIIARQEAPDTQEATEQTETPAVDPGPGGPIA